MATVYLHIGLPKTGTTAIQHFLHNNEEALGKHGICFPSFEYQYDAVGTLRNAHFLSACYDKNNISPEHYIPVPEYTLIMEQISVLSEKYDKILLTDEVIWRTGMIHSDFWPTIKAELNQRGLTLKVIVYLRRQDSFIQSRYRQHIKVGGSCSFYEFLEIQSQRSYPYDFYTPLTTIKSHVGEENLIVRVYEKGQFKGSDHSLLSDFLDILGLTKADGFMEAEKLFNPSLEGSFLELRSLLNTLSETPKNIPVLNSSFREIHRRYPNSSVKKTLFKPGDQKLFLEKFEESNSRVAREFLNREDGILFYEPFEELPYEETSTEELLRNTILIFGQAIQKLEKKNKKLEARLETLSQTPQKTSLFSDVKQKVKHLLGK